MSFEPTADERAIRDTVRRFAREVLAPHAAELDETAAFPSRHLPALAELGIMGMNLPESCGGAGIGARALSLVIAEIAGACAATASVVTAHYLATDAIAIAGSDAQRQRFLPRAATGKALGAFALTEPAAGSNPADMTMRAEVSAEGYRLRGVKHFISNGGVADFVVVFARTDAALGARGISAFIVERGTAGFSAMPPERTMGLRGGHIVELAFDCTIPEENRLGPEGSGFRTALAVLDRGRIEVASMCLGIAKTALDAALDWARTRRVGGGTLADFQAIQFMLADMAVGHEAARLLTLQAATLRENGLSFTRAAAMAKLHASEMAAMVTDRALQIHGGYGYTRAHPLERHVRDVRVMRIYEGSSEIQRAIIARALLKE